MISHRKDIKRISSALGFALILLPIILTMFVVSECTGKIPPTNTSEKDDSYRSTGLSSISTNSYPTLQVTINGPSVLATSNAEGEKAEYKISIRGGPASTADKNLTVNWSYTAILLGEYANSANKSSVSPASGNSNITGNFTLNVTAPIKECTIILAINGTSAIVGNESQTVERKLIITVVKPVILSAEVHNYGQINVKNINLSFYVDNKFIGYKVITSIGANSSTNVTINWTVTDYSVGFHKAKVVITGGGPMILFANGSNTMSYEFYVGSLSPDPWNKILLALGSLLLVIVIVLFIIAYFSTGRPPAQPIKKL